MEGDVHEAQVSKLENRWLSMLVAVAIGFGGWWLQNMYMTVMRQNERIDSLLSELDQRYVNREVMRLTTERIDRIQQKVEKHYPQ